MTAAIRTEDELAREMHGMLTRIVERAPLFADLRARGIAEDLIQETMLTVTRKLRESDAIEDPLAYAGQCLTNLAKRTYLRHSRELATGEDTIERLVPAVQDVADHVALRMSTAEVLEMVRLVNAVLDDLAPMELELVRAELQRADHKKLAARLGISRPTLYRRKGPAVTAFVSAVAARAGTTPCSEHAAALLAAAADSGFDGARAASEHAAECAECRETIRHLAVARHGMAAIAPIPLFAAAPDPTGVSERFAATLHAALDWVRAAAVRVGDPMPFGGTATKTVALVATACAGGGGVYCAVDGLPPVLRAPAHHAAPASAARPAAPPTRSVAAGIVPASRSIQTVARDARAAEQEARRVAAAAAARRRSRAAARERARIAQEFAARTTAPTAGGEFTPPAAGSSGVVQREFSAPTTSSATSAATQEFGTP